MLPAAGGVAFLRLCLAGCLRFLSVLRCRPVGPIPGTAPLRLCVKAPQGRAGSGAGSGSGFGPGAKKAEGVPPPVCRFGLICP